MIDSVELGDYVLATKYCDGDPCDHFCVGYVSGRTWHGRWLVVDGGGREMRFNGFRRVERITADEGRELVGMMSLIGDVPGPSVWSHLDRLRGVSVS